MANTGWHNTWRGVLRVKRGMLLAAVVFLFSVGYYVLIWQPLSERIEDRRRCCSNWWTNTRLRSAAPDIIAARKSATTAPAQVSRVISDSASAHSVVIKRIASVGEYSGLDRTCGV
ncbi:type II secretion system protein GspM [Escherichia coli]